MAEDQYSPLVQDRAPLNTVKYAARDFVTIADDLLRRLKIEYADDYNDYAVTSQGIMLLELVAWAYAELTWYLDRTASDCFLETARTRAAVERLVEQIAYKMRPAAASGTTLTLTFPAGTPSGFIMQDRWRFSGPNGLNFESYAKVIQPTALGIGATLSVDVRQGDTKVLTYTADGTKNQSYRLVSIPEDRYLAVDATEVWVDGKLWTENDFLEFAKTDQYEISYLANPPVIRFGDGLAGNIPPAGSEVKIRFLIIDGKAGNVRAETINSSVDVLTINSETVLFEVNNGSRATGGDDPETAEHAKRLAPSSFAARGVAITKEDYETLSDAFVDSTYGSVAKSYAISPKSSFSDVEFDSLVTDIEILLSEYVTLASSLDTSISTDYTNLDSAMSLVLVSVDNMRDFRTSYLLWSGTAKAGCVTAKDLCNEAISRSKISADRSGDSISTIQALITYINDGNSNSDYILTELQSALVAMTTAEQEASGAWTASTSCASSIDNVVITNVDYISESTSDDGDFEAELDSLSSHGVSAIASASNIDQKLTFLYGSASTMSSNVLVDVSSMRDRLGVLFSDDCLSNYVQVPILALDLNGDYVSPSAGLKSALQTYLDSVKEVTQVVEVVDGSPILVPAVIQIIATANIGYVKSEVKSQIESVVVDLLKRRDFNSPLYLSDLYDVVDDSSAGIKNTNITITGPTQYIDGNGNLVTNENQVVVLGNLSVTVN